VYCERAIGRVGILLSGEEDVKKSGTNRKTRKVGESKNGVRPVRRRAARATSEGLVSKLAAVF
jgi:hypothetical protein